ncbi:MAG: excisionase family DNA-binding protein [Candidatus Omnitrophica bacterium]|nr:excisionase family DNA-binding protein [Candidatus Omnitrophota bacterium]
MPAFVRHNDYLTTAEASKFLNVTRFTILNWIKEGKLQSASTFGGHQRIPRAVVLSALKQIQTTKRIKIAPPQKKTDTVVNCWESEEITSCGTHNCNKCLVFKKKLNRCFLAIGSYGSLKRECAHDCLNCSYLANHYPQEKKAMQRMMLKGNAKFQNHGTNKKSVQGLLKKVFYNSGRLVGSIKKQF